MAQHSIIKLTNIRIIGIHSVHGSNPTQGSFFFEKRESCSGCIYLPCFDLSCMPLSFDLGVFGGLIIPAFSFRLSLSSPVYQVSCFVLYTWIRTQPAGAALVAQLVEHSPRTRSVVGSNPTQGSFFFEKRESCSGCIYLPCFDLS